MYNFLINLDPPRDFSKVVGNTIGICKLIITEYEIKFSHVLSLTNEIFDELNIIKN